LERGGGEEEEEEEEGNGKAQLVVGRISCTRVVFLGVCYSDWIGLIETFRMR